jgi:hypothetical protein
MQAGNMTAAKACEEGKNKARTIEIAPLVVF